MASVFCTFARVNSPRCTLGRIRCSTGPISGLDLFPLEMELRSTAGSNHRRREEIVELSSTNSGNNGLRFVGVTALRTATVDCSRHVVIGRAVLDA